MFDLISRQAKEQRDNGRSGGKESARLDDIDGDLNQQVRLYLDAKPQRVDIDGKPHVLRFADRLKTLLINGHPFKVGSELNSNWMND